MFKNQSLLAHWKQIYNHTQLVLFLFIFFFHFFCFCINVLTLNFKLNVLFCYIPSSKSIITSFSWDFCFLRCFSLDLFSHSLSYLACLFLFFYVVIFLSSLPPTLLCVQSKQASESGTEQWCWHDTLLF